MELIASPSLLGHTLGWARIAVAVAARQPGETEAPPTGTSAIPIRLSKRLEAWAREREAQTTGGELRTTRLSDAVKLARELRLISDDEQPTDLGRVLAVIDADAAHEPGFPFALTRESRWVLWFASAQADGAAWRALLSTWDSGVDAMAWVRAAADYADLPSLLATNARTARVRVQRVENLGWDADALGRLKAWVASAPVEWEPSNFVSAFAHAECLDLRAPSPGRLRQVLVSIAPELRSFPEPKRTTAPLAAIRHMLTVSALRDGVVEDWFGAQADAILAAEPDVAVVAGATGDDANLAWPDDLDPAAPEVLDDPSPVPLPLPPLPPLPPRASSVLFAPEAVRARAWLRFCAWWLRGPTPASVLLGHHLPRQHAVDTILRWTGDESTRWNNRLEAIAGVVPPTILGSLRSGGAAAEACACMGRVACVHLQAMIDRVRNEDPSPLCVAIIERWLGGLADWLEAESATADLLGHLVDTRAHTAEELRLRLRDERDDPTGAASRFLFLLQEIPTGQAVQIECDLLVRAPTRLIHELEYDESLRDACQRASLDLSLVGHDVVGHRCVRAVRAVAVLSEPPLVAATRLHRDAVDVLESAVAVARSAWCSAFDRDYAHVLTGEGEDLLLSPAQRAAAEGWGFWERSDWFEPRRGVARPPTFRPASASEPRIADRLMHLWLGLEHAVDRGDSGKAVIAPLAKAAVAAWASAALDDALEASTLVGAPLERPSTWDGFGAGWAESDSLSCPFAEQRRKDAIRGRDLRVPPKKGPKSHEPLLIQAVWVFRAVYDARNRVVHKGWHDPFEERAALARTWENAAVVWGWLESIRGSKTWDALERPFALGLEGTSRSPLDVWRVPP